MFVICYGLLLKGNQFVKDCLLVVEIFVFDVVFCCMMCVEVQYCGLVVLVIEDQINFCNCGFEGGCVYDWVKSEDWLLFIILVLNICFCGVGQSVQFSVLGG